jgi:hypothetical protein
MRALRETEAVTQLEEAPRCLSCEGLLERPEPGSGEWPCVRCGAVHHASGQAGLWHVRPMAGRGMDAPAPIRCRRAPW